jgi:uncharacterized protein
MRKALIVWGGWDGHEPELCADIYKSWLKEDGFAVTVSAETKAFADPDLKRFDLIVPIYTMSKIEKEEALNLCTTIETGTGLGGHHGGMADAFRDNVDYQFMVGGQWVAHPGNIIDYHVDIEPVVDDITKGIQRFAYRSEQYYMHVDPANRVLASTTFTGEHASWIKGVKMPVVWKRHHGKGRVFYSSLGHVASEFKVPEMATMLRRGVNWAARK